MSYLFDRFAQGASGAQAEGVDAVLSREVGRLLSTRSVRGSLDVSRRRRSVLDYGLADGLVISPQRRLDDPRLRGAIRHAIHAYVPGLVVQQIEFAVPDARAVVATIHASVSESNGRCRSLAVAIRIDR